MSLSYRESSQERPGGAIDSRSSRYRFMVVALVVVILTLLFARSPAWGWQGFSVLAVLWIVLGYILYINAARAYLPEARSDRPHLSLGRGIPAWVFFLGGTLGLVVVAVASALAAIRARNEVAGRRLALAGSLVVIAAGTFWFIERVFFSGGTL